MAKNIIMAPMCFIFMFASAACEFNSDKPETSGKDKIVKSRSPLFIETYPAAEGEMAASPFLTKPVPEAALTN